MKFTKYDNLEAFGADTYEILHENEVQNNLPISFINNERGYDTTDWLLTTIKDDAGGVVLTAACTPPFNLVMYETGNEPNDRAVALLSRELKAMGADLPGVLAEQGLARRFAEAYAGTHAGTDAVTRARIQTEEHANAKEHGYHRHKSMNIMQLDRVCDIRKAPGRCRPLREDDLLFAPYWERAFSEECEVETYDIPTNVERISGRVGMNNHYIWEDGHPVSQAYNMRHTRSGACISGVYTPPQYRGKGYASSVVAELSLILLERGNKFCYLFADAENPISCGIYRKLGYHDICVFDEIKFD